jgi:putative transposase
LAKQKECTIEEGHLMPDHVHMLIAIPPKHSVATIVGFLKGKSSIWVAQNIANKQRNFVGHKFWARGGASKSMPKISPLFGFPFMP